MGVSLLLRSALSQSIYKVVYRVKLVDLVGHKAFPSVLNSNIKPDSRREMIRSAFHENLACIRKIFHKQHRSRRGRLPLKEVMFDSGVPA